MKRSKFTEEQIIAVLREHEAELSTVGEMCRKHVRSQRLTPVARASGR